MMRINLIDLLKKVITEESSAMTFFFIRIVSREF